MAKERKKLNSDIVSLRKTGASVIGTYKGEFVKQWERVNEATGEFEPTKATVLQFEDKKGILFGLWLDGGLKPHHDLIKTAGMVEIVKTGQKELEGGKRCNTYDIFSAET